MTLPKHYTCIGCGLTDKRVEAGGIYYCPNPACTAVGAYWARSKLKSFTPSDDGRTYRIDADELIRCVNEMDERLDEEISIVAEMCISLFWSKA